MSKTSLILIVTFFLAQTLNSTEIFGVPKIIDGDTVHINNKKRLVRALEIFGTTGKAPSINYQNQKSNPTKVLDLFTIRLDWDRKNLNDRIYQRLDSMLLSGWIEEVNDLISELFFSYYQAN